MGTINTSDMIAQAYVRDREKVEVVAFKSAFRESRKYGFPVTNTILHKDEEEQILWAAKLLLHVASTWLRDNIPEDFQVPRTGALYEDAKLLVGSATANTLRQGTTA